ncbi:MAG: hypothetical protein PHY02_09595 [Phycisphaerae bacterium]|nr:hypothetical protein [Phycisphaerae bacterium]
MPSKNTTTVVLNSDLQKIKNELASVYGLKNVLSAGLLLFSRLSAEDRQRIIAEVNSDDNVPCQTTLVLLTEDETKNLRKFQAEMQDKADKKKHKKLG